MLTGQQVISRRTRVLGAEHMDNLRFTDDFVYYHLKLSKRYFITQIWKRKIGLESTLPLPPKLNVPQRFAISPTCGKSTRRLFGTLKSNM